MYRFFYYKSVNSAYIEDLSQDVYIRFYNKFSDKELSEVESKKILYGIARNVYKEWVRQSIKEKRVSLLDNFEYEELDHGDLLDLFLELENPEFDEKLLKNQEILKEAIETLGENVRNVIKMRFVEGLSRKEVAEKLNIKEKDVHTYQKRGVKYLKKLITNYEL